MSAGRSGTAPSACGLRKGQRRGDYVPTKETVMDALEEERKNHLQAKPTMKKRDERRWWGTISSPRSSCRPLAKGGVRISRQSITGLGKRPGGRAADRAGISAFRAFYQVGRPGGWGQLLSRMRQGVEPTQQRFSLVWGRALPAAVPASGRHLRRQLGYFPASVWPSFPAHTKRSMLDDGFR
jgi:hypothetical protein